MNGSHQILKYSLLAGSAYFLCIALAHLIGLKIPGLYIYFNVPSLAYQDRIISFLAFGWSMFFYAGARHPAVVRLVLIASAVALAGLVNINLAGEFGSAAVEATPFWVQTALLGGYVGWLAVFAVRGGLLRP